MEFRRLCDTDPNTDDPSFGEHARACAACARELERARKFDALLGAAMCIDVPTTSIAVPTAETSSVDVPPAETSGIDVPTRAETSSIDLPEAELSRGELDPFEAAAIEQPFRARVQRLWIGLAASLVVAVGVGAGLWFAARPRAVLAADVVAHIRGEPEALRKDRPPVDMDVVQSLLAQHGIRLGEQIGRISYIRICPFEGKQVPHLVVEGPSGPVTVMLLLGAHPSGAIAIDEAGFTGRIVPAGSGSIVIVGSAGGVDAAEQNRIIDAVAWEA